MVQLSQWKSEQMVFVDESALNERTADRKWGWAPIGMPCLLKFQRSQSVDQGLFGSPQVDYIPLKISTDCDPSSVKWITD